MKCQITLILFVGLTSFAGKSLAQQSSKAPHAAVKIPIVPTPVTLGENTAILPVIPLVSLPVNAVSVETTVDKSPKSAIPKVLPVDRSPSVLPSKPEIIKPIRENLPEKK